MEMERIQGQMYNKCPTGEKQRGLASGTLKTKAALFSVVSQGNQLVSLVSVTSCQWQLVSDAIDSLEFFFTDMYHNIFWPKRYYILLDTFYNGRQKIYFLHIFYINVLWVQCCMNCQLKSTSSEQPKMTWTGWGKTDR